MRYWFHIFCLGWVAAFSAQMTAEGDHWAFAPLKVPAPPPVKHTSWANQPLDFFILHHLEAKGLTPNPPADRETLIRRVWFDVLGLPPEPDEMDRFLSDQTSNAYGHMIDALLASPHYGERWGRHWLDVARYGDSNGGDENHHYPHAFRYRNWVLDALNADMPYHRFVQEQLAGDITPWSNERSLAGTGFLAIGTKIQAEQDPIKKRADTIDEQLDTLGRTFMGLSIGCARCHDHKFDPISERDYYALAGILYSTDIEDREAPTQEGKREEQAWKKRLNAIEQSIQEVTRKFEALRKDGQMMEWEAEKFDRGNVTIDTDRYGKDIGIISDPGSQENFVEYDIDMEESGDFLLELRYAAQTARPGQILLDQQTVFTNALSKVTGGWMPEHQQWLLEGTFRIETGPHVLRIQSKPLMSHIDRIRLTSVNGSADIPSVMEELARLNKQKTELEAQRPVHPKLMAVSEGTIQNIQLNIRGNPHDLGDPIPRGFLTHIGTAKLPEVNKNQSGRWELSQWMTSPDHPLTARVIVNRIWQWHFGRGLVATPDNFGKTGQAPSHPELLDWLTTDFIQHGWSLKWLHRRILLSSVYQLSSDDGVNPSAKSMDPDNRMLWKHEIRRLDAESFRDALLSISGSFNANAHLKEPIQVKAQDPSSEDIANNRTAYESFPHRTVYLPVVRSHTYDLLALLDFPNATAPVGKRSQTTVPTQALMMFNSAFVVEMTERAARNWLRTTTNEEDRLNAMYRVLLTRDPTTEERSACHAYLSQSRRILEEQKAWETLCHALILSNEFMYVR